VHIAGILGVLNTLLATPIGLVSGKFVLLRVANSISQLGSFCDKSDPICKEKDYIILATSG
jgi:hypothetical protein